MSSKISRQAWARLNDAELAIGTARNYRLTELEMKLPTVKLYGNDVGFKLHQAGNATDFGIGFAIGPHP